MGQIPIPPYPNLVVILPLLLVSGLLALLVVMAWFIPKEREEVFVPVSLAGYGLALLATLALGWVYAAPADEFSRSFRLDAFNLAITAITLIAALIAVALSTPYLALRRLARAEYHILLACSMVGGLVVAGATDLMVIFLGIELISIPVYVLTGFAKRDRASNEASLKYFLLGAFASAILLYGMAWTYGVTGSTNLFAIADALRTAPLGPATRAPAGGLDAPLATGSLVTVALLFLIAGLGFKAAVVPFHMWTPDAYQGAPTPVTAFMSTVPKVAALAAFVRVLVEAFPTHAADWRLVLAVLAVLTMTLGNVTALAQRSVKRMLAYSSIAHTGYLLVGLAAWLPPRAGVPVELNNLPVGSIVFYLFTYVFLNLGAFGLIAWYQNHGGGETYDDFAGLAATAPAAAFGLAVLMLGLTGVPPTAGFLGKYYLFSSAIENGLTWLAVVGVLNSAVSAYFYLGVIVQMYMREPKLAIASPRSPLMAAALGLCVLVTLFLFLGPLQNAVYLWAIAAGAP